VVFSSKHLYLKTQKKHYTAPHGAFSEYNKKTCAVKERSGFFCHALNAVQMPDSAIQMLIFVKFIENNRQLCYDNHVILHL